MVNKLTIKCFVAVFVLINVLEVLIFLLSNTYCHPLLFSSHVFMSPELFGCRFGQGILRKMIILIHVAIGDVMLGGVDLSRVIS